MVEPIPDNTIVHDGTELTWIEVLMLRYRFAASIILHTILFTLALLLAYLVQYDIRGMNAKPWFLSSFLPWLPFFVIVKLLTFGKMKLLSSGWRYASIRDIVNILLACWWSVLIIFLIVLIFLYLPKQFGRQAPTYFKAYSPRILILDFMATVFLVATAKLAFRLYREELRPVAAEGVKRLMIVGAGNASETLIRELNRMREETYRIIGMVDDDPTKKHLHIHGVPVLGVTPKSGNFVKTIKSTRYS